MLTKVSLLLFLGRVWRTTKVEKTHNLATMPRFRIYLTVWDWAWLGLVLSWLGLVELGLFLFDRFLGGSGWGRPKLSITTNSIKEVP